MILGLIRGNDSIYLFDSHRKDEKGNLSSSGTTVLLTFDMLHSLENYIKSVYLNISPITLYFQVQFKKVHGIANAMTAFKYKLKRE